MLFKQLNLNKSKNACDILCHMISKSKTETVYLLQEPYRLKNGRVPGVPRNYLVFGEKDSRAIIIAPKNSKFGYCPEFSSKDISTCLFMGLKKCPKCWNCNLVQESKAELYLDLDLEFAL